MERPSHLDLLLVEDSPDHIELASRVFRKMDPPLNVQVIQDGEEALEFIFGRGVYEGQGVASLKLIILDLYLPRVPGAEILRQLREDPRTQSIPVAILTVTGNERPALEKAPFNVKHYLRKPLELNDFLALYESYIKPS